MPFTGRTSAIVVPVPLPAQLEAIRQRHVVHARLGVPAHVTLLVPFVPPPEIDGAVIARAAAAVARTPAFDVGFTRVAHWDPSPITPNGVVWLPPERAGPFVAMTEALVEAFPAYLPYGGIHDEVIPHLTLGNADLEIGATEEAARGHVPFRRRITTATLLVEDESGRWRTARRLPLG